MEAGEGVYPYSSDERPGADPDAPTVPGNYPPGAIWPPASPIGGFQGSPPPAPPRRTAMVWAPFLGGVIVTLVIIVVVLALIRNGIVTLPSQVSARTPVATGISATATTTSAATTPAPSTPTTTAAAPTTTAALVPTGALLYAAALPGQCDAQGATWATNGYVGQFCNNGALQAQGANCNCALGVVVLQRLPTAPVPTQYVLQVAVQSIGPGDTDRFGVKFYQVDTGVTPPDTGNTRGGYSFLIDRTGAWQFNRYTDDGTRDTLDSGVYGPGMTGQHTIDLSVGASSFAFFIDGALVATEYDTAYSAGLLDLAVEPGAVVLYRNFALYRQPGQ
ncbi:MAG TPA: hypothetical protein VMV29_25100 [Ktedonobacterales bacterium]|nr:hypothetical protein [Ktedonobacterales bacterium]